MWKKGYYFTSLIIFVLTIALITGFKFFSKITKENLYELPFIRVELPDNNQPYFKKILSTDNATFVVLGTKKMDENLYNTKIFLISSEGKILDTFEGSNKIGLLDKIPNIGIVASDYSSPFIGGNLNFVLSIENGKIAQKKMLDETINIFELPRAENEATSPNISISDKCYLALDIGGGGCTYGLTTIKVDDKIGYTTKNTVLGSTKIDENHTVVLIRSNVIRDTYELLILGSN